MVAAEHLSLVVVDAVVSDAAATALDVVDVLDVVGARTQRSKENATAAGWPTIMRTLATS